jgi:hypothetical protein
MKIQNVWRVRCRKGWGVLLRVLVVLVGVWAAHCGVAQQAGQLPNAPSVVAGRLGEISGTVTDTDGAAVPGATVTLSGGVATAPITAVTDGEGYFSFNGLGPGKFTVDVVAKGFAGASVAGVLTAGQDDTLADVELRAGEVMEVSALTQYQLAEIDVKAEETQHVLGVLPNFFMTYDWHAPPLSTRQKYELAWKSVIDPAGNVLNAATAGVYQAFDILPGYNQGAEGYFKRLGAVEADGAVGLYVGSAVLPALLHQDPRYFYMGKNRGTVKQRAWYAVKSAVICRSDKGKNEFNWSGVIGDLASGAASNLYYPAGSTSGATLTIEGGLLSVAGDAVSNLAQEFVVRWFTPHAPKPSP